MYIGLLTKNLRHDQRSGCLCFGSSHILLRDQVFISCHVCWDTSHEYTLRSSQLLLKFPGCLLKYSRQPLPMMECMHQFSTRMWANTAKTSVLAVRSRWDPNMKIPIPFPQIFYFLCFLVPWKCIGGTDWKKGRVKDCKQVRNTGKLT